MSGPNNQSSLINLIYYDAEPAHGDGSVCRQARQRDADCLAAIAVLEKSATDPTRGLPDEVFYFVSRMTPMMNVDLLIQDEASRVLLAWRDDPLAGRGWHIPGGIIRFKETMEERIHQVAIREVGMPVAYDPNPVAIHQIICRKFIDRGHFISILFRCRLPSSFSPANQDLTPSDPGYLAWHETCPSNLVSTQEIYRPYWPLR